MPAILFTIKKLKSEYSESAIYSDPQRAESLRRFAWMEADASYGQFCANRGKFNEPFRHMGEIYFSVTTGDGLMGAA